VVHADGNSRRGMRRAIRGELEALAGYVRAMNYIEPAVRRRSLPIPLLFGGSSGPLGWQSGIS
jgi:hypothetical protein